MTFRNSGSEAFRQPAGTGAPKTTAHNNTINIDALTNRRFITSGSLSLRTVFVLFVPFCGSIGLQICVASFPC
jgi:hypothetical protein